MTLSTALPLNNGHPGQDPTQALDLAVLAAPGARGPWSVVDLKCRKRKCN